MYYKFNTSCTLTIVSHWVHICSLPFSVFFAGWIDGEHEHDTVQGWLLLLVVTVRFLIKNSFLKKKKNSFLNSCMELTYKRMRKNNKKVFFFSQKNLSIYPWNIFGSLDNYIDEIVCLFYRVETVKKTKDFTVDSGMKPSFSHFNFNFNFSAMT